MNKKNPALSTIFKIEKCGNKKKKFIIDLSISPQIPAQLTTSIQTRDWEGAVKKVHKVCTNVGLVLNYVKC